MSSACLPRHPSVAYLFLVDMNLAKKIPSWTALRRFGTSRVLRTSYFWLFFVPIAAKLLLQLKNPLHLDIFGEIHVVHFTLPFSWYCFYFAAIAFSAATLLYSTFCPKVIKEYSSF